MNDFPRPIEASNAGDGSPLTLGEPDMLGDLFISNTSSLHVVDFDGDGRNELVASGREVLTFGMEGAFPDETPIAHRGLRWGLGSRAPQRPTESDSGLCGNILAVGDFDDDGRPEIILGPRGYSESPRIVLRLEDEAPTDRSQGVPLELLDSTVKVKDNVQSKLSSDSMTAFDWNGDGKLDLIVSSRNDEGYNPIDPATGQAPVDQRDRYTRDGRWKGNDVSWSLHLFRNTGRGKPQFDYVGPIDVLPPGGVLCAVSPQDPTAGLLVAGYYGDLWHLPLLEGGAKPRWGEPAELLSLHGAPFTRTANFTSFAVGDVDGQGRPDLFATDLSSNVYWCRSYGQDKNGRPVYDTPRKIKQRNPHVNGGMFSVPTSGDWRGTGMPDLVVGSIEGYLFWYKTLSTNPLRFAPPERVRLGDEEIRRYAKPNPAAGYHWGSSQGPEDGFNGGYSNPVLADWDGDGLLDLIVGDMIGLYDWFPNRGTGTDPRLGFPMRLTVDGHDLVAPWRVQPGIADFTGNGLPDLITMDHDLDLVLYLRSGREDLTALQPGKKLLYEDGDTIKTHGPYTPPGGDGRGRTKVQVVDWNHNGKWDLILGVGPQPDSTFIGSFVLLCENVGTNTEPIFKRPVPLLFDSKGTPLEFWRHASHPTAVDFDGDGKWELVVGANQGYLWYFKPEHFGKPSDSGIPNLFRENKATWP